VRTLVISDLHLGNRAERDVLRRPAPLERLTEAASQCDRLVILGDCAELVTRSPGGSLAVAETAMRAVGARLGPHQEVILVPGNHDRPLIRGWARAQGTRLSLDGTVPLTTTAALARVSSWFAPAQVSVHYPGVWLEDGVYATHGHYLDRHLMPHAPIGLPRPAGSAAAAARASPWEYERRRFQARRRRDGRARPVAAARQLAVRTLNPALPRLLMRAGLSPLTASAVDLQMRHAALPAMRTVLTRLGVEANVVIFGHVHRLGPLSADDPGEWDLSGTPRLLNTGSWLYEQLLVDRARTPHPYWPGGAVQLEPGSPPRIVGLLDDLDHGQLSTRK
jgi:UDP-2,3-diacylglucosamine pyrophosphatase LpxH